MLAAVTGSVLVVDDDSGFRSLAKRMLSAIGLTVVGEADTAAAALAAAAALKPDAALVDVALPDRDGVALAHELVALPWRPRVVLTSTDADAASLEDVRTSGADAFVPKAELPGAPLRRLLGGPAPSAGQ
jgi:DNA-binding NarL/FixJ family response regulator